MNYISPSRGSILSGARRHSSTSTLRYPKIIEQRVQAILSATAMTTDPAVIVPNQLLVEVLVQQLRVVLPAIKRFDVEIAQLAATMPDFALFSTLPGAGTVFGSGLLAGFGEQHDRYASAAAVQKVRWHCSGHRAQRQTMLGVLATAVPHVLAPDLRRVDGTVHPGFVLGKSGL
jgi:hypothetical protein